MTGGGLAADGGRGGGSQLAGSPPGLTQIGYRAGDFASFLDALLTPLPEEQQLTDWAPGAGDLGLMVLEWWAYLADILTFYNERIANGSYLPTAAAQPGPPHAAGLAALLGYRPAPAITATGAVAVLRDPAGDGKLVIPAGLQLASTPTEDAPAQLFEVTDGHTFTGPTDTPIVLPSDPALFGSAGGQPAAGGAGGGGPRTVLLARSAAVSPGDQLILVSRAWTGGSADWAVVTATAAAAERDPAGPANTRVTLTAADWHDLASGAPLAAGYRLLRARSTALLWTGSAQHGGQHAVSSPESPAGPSAVTFTVPLATVVRAVSPGDIVVFTGSVGGSTPRAIALAAHVTGYAEEVTQVPATAAGGSPAHGPAHVYIPHTYLTVRTTGARQDVAALLSAVGTRAAGGIAMQYGFRDVSDLVPTPAQTLDSLPVTVTGRAGLALPGGPVALEDASGTGLLVTATATGTPGTVTLWPADGAGQGPLEAPLRAPVRLLAALVPVSRGTTVRAEVLGDGNPAAASQAFTLRHSPLIYLPPAGPDGGPVAALSVSVNQVPWRAVPAFSGQRHDATVYVVSELSGGTVEIRFGDGVNGARLPLGTGNVTATYRYGPSATAPPAGKLDMVLQPQPNLAAVRNPLAITPGTAPEPAAVTAEAAPASTVLLRRASAATAPVISLGDSERLAATVSGVTRARAYWTWDQELSRPAITVYVSSESDTAAAVTAVGRLFPSGTSRVPLTAAPAHGVPLAVRCQLRCLPGTQRDAVLAAATGALTGADGLFSPRRMGIGQRLHRSQVEAALMVGGAATVTGLHVHRPGQGDEPEETALDPGQDGYFSLPGKELSISVVSG